MIKKIIAAALLLLPLWALSAQSASPNPRANVVQTLLDTAKIQDPEARLKAYDNLAKLLAPERITPNPWTISLTKDEANDLMTYVISNKKIVDPNNAMGFNINILYVKRSSFYDSYVRIYLSGNSVDVKKPLTNSGGLFSWKYKYENGDASEDKWSCGNTSRNNSDEYWVAKEERGFSLAPFPGKLLNEFSVHDTIFFISETVNYKFDIRGLSVALGKYNLSLDELIKVAENSQGI